MEVKSTNERTSLSPAESVDLWLKGKDAWNLWVKINPDADIDFSLVDFGHYVERDGQELVHFAEFIFPNGMTNFSHSIFPNGVTFMGANFNNGNKLFRNTSFGGIAFFKKAKFGHGDKSFQGADFCDEATDPVFGNADFSEVSFGTGFIDFSFSKAKKVSVSFDDANLGKGLTSFRGVQFGRLSCESTDFESGMTSFNNAKIGLTSHVSFSRCIFGKGDVDFTGTHFGDHLISFSSCRFGCEKVDFRGAIFGKGTTFFNKAIFNNTVANFEHCRFLGQVTAFTGAYFNNTALKLKHSEFHGHTDLSHLSGALSVLDISHCSIAKTFNISDNVFSTVPDLTCTKTEFPISLERMTLNIKYKPFKSIFRKPIANLLVFLFGLKKLPLNYKKLISFGSTNIFTPWINRSRASIEDEAKIRKLKSFAEENKDNRKTLELHILEMKSARWRSNKKASNLFLEFLFDIFSDYGRSEKRPLVTLFGLGCCFAPIYTISATNTKLCFLDKLSNSLTLSYSQMLPLLQSSKAAQLSAGKQLYGGEIPNIVFILGGIQNITSLILIFLIGLALRNRFRI